MVINNHLNLSQYYNPENEFRSKSQSNLFTPTNENSFSNFNELQKKTKQDINNETGGLGKIRTPQIKFMVYVKTQVK